MAPGEDEQRAELEALRRRVERLRRAGKRLRLGQQRYRSLVEATTAIVWNTPASGEFEVPQPRWSAFTGQTFEQLKGWGWLDAVHPDDRPDTARVWSAAVASRSLYHVEHRLRRHDGAYRHMLVRAVPILDDDGTIREWVGVHTDVTSQKEAEAALREATAAAEAANRAKGDFLANMSHEVRTPLNGILGMTELALETDLTPEQRRYLELVKGSADALLMVVNDILDFSKIEAGKFELDSAPFRLRDRLGDTLKALALRAHRKGLELACDVGPDVPDALVGDPGRLGQVVINLVGNAVKFTSRGEVVLAVRRADDGGGHEGAVALRFEVRDTGPGIPRDAWPRLFQPFSQADTSTTRQFGGTGLGLMIARRLVELMGGRIGFDSVPGVGSTFHFTAPFATQPPGADADDAEPIRLRGLPVLAVDDNATNRLILREMLARWGMAPATAEGAAEALAILRDAAAAGSPFPLVLSDVMMPGVDGFGLADRLAREPDLPRPAVILLSSADDAQAAARGREAGVAAYLTKPVKPSELLDAILGALDPAPTAETAARGRRPPAARPRPLEVLLVEDNATNQMLALALLERDGHAVETALNGREALDALERRRFDVVLMDVQMPVMDGLEATARIRARERDAGGHVPIVAMTAHAMKGDRERCLAAGMDGYVSKPVRPEALRAALAGVAAPDGPAPPSPFALDRDALLARVGGRADRLESIVRVFLDEAAALLAQLRDALDAGDAPALARSSHSLKGAVGLFGAPSIVAFAEAIESHARAGDLAAAAAAFGPLARQLADLRAALTTLLDSP